MHTRGRIHRSLFIEELEARIAPGVTVSLVDGPRGTPESLISPEWFETLSPFSPDTTAYSGAYAERSSEIITWRDELVQVRPDEWIVQFRDSAIDSLSSVQDAVGLFSSTVEIVQGLGMAGQVLIRTPEIGVDAVTKWLSADPNIAYFHPNTIIEIDATPNDPDFVDLWGLHNTGQTGGIVDADIDAPEAWDLTTGSAAIVIGVIDSGVDYTHPDLVASIWTNPGEIAGNLIDDDGNGFVDDVHGYDFYNNDSDPMDDHSHGTHVAGTIAGVGDNGVGVVGVNWTSSIMALKFLGAGGTGSTADAVRAVNYATMMRTTYGIDIRLTNNSWGGGVFDQALYDAIEASGNAGLLFVAAAGNDGKNNDVKPYYPARYDLPNIIAVASTDHNDNLAGTSNYGASSVDLAAPGVSILSTVPGGYGYKSGTSMATPHVTGVAALAWSFDPSATADQIRDAILASVDPIPSLNGVVATGGRLNARGTLDALGYVANSSPADGAVITAAPTVFTIDFSYSYDPATVDVGDLQVNGLSPDSVVGVDGDTVQFTFNTSPVSAEGPQIMHMDAAAVSSLATGKPLMEWNAVFHYDAVPMTVVSTSPADGSIVPLGPLSIAFNFNEVFNPTSIGIDDLVLSEGSVVSATSVDSDTARYEVAGITSEGTLTFSIDAGKILDPYGNPNTAYSGSLEIDVTTTAYPTPLTATAPLGSLIYDPSLSGIVNFAGDIDSFTIDLDAGQTLSVVADPVDGSMQLRLRLDGGAWVDASASGLATVLQTAPITLAGTHTVDVSSLSGTGAYTLEFTLNAAVEEESYDGLDNSTLATAQNIDGSFIALAGTAARGAALGVGDMVPSGSSHTYVSTDVPQAIRDLSFAVSTIDIADTFLIADVDVQLDITHGWDADLVVYLEAPDATRVLLFASVGGSGDNFTNTILDDEASTLITGGSAPFTGRFQPMGTLSDLDGKNAAGTWTLEIYDQSRRDKGTLQGWSLTITEVNADPVEDWYSFGATTGDSVSIGIDTAEGTAHVALYDSLGTLLASGAAGATNLDESINLYTIPATDTYYVSVSEVPESSYSLVVLRNAELEREGNDSLASAQIITDTEGALGYVESEDWYSYTIATDERLYLRTHTLADGSGEFVNELDPHIELYDSLGTLVATGVGLVEGRNEEIDYVGAAGTYYIRVGADAATSGEYFLYTDIGIDEAAPTASLAVPLDNGPSDLDPGDKQVLVNSPQLSFAIQLDDGTGSGIDDSTVTSSAVSLKLGAQPLALGSDYTFSYNTDTDQITLGMISPTDGVYEIAVSEPGLDTIRDNAGNAIVDPVFTVVVDTTGDTITGLAAKTESGGSDITEGTWQSDDDPYLYWALPLSDAPIVGYSYAVDASPDEVIDISDPWHQVAPDQLSNGVHTFRVKAEDEAGNWGPVASFEIWVDDTAPTVVSITPEVVSSFVSSDGTGFVADGGPFYVAGTNTYYLMVYAADAGLQGYVDEVLEEAAEMGLNVIRTWAFNDGSGWNALQTAPGVYDETVFQGLDYVIAKASDLGLRVILPFVNHWDDYGGMDQYVAWDSVYGVGPETATVRNDFYTDSDTRQWYKDHVATVLNRENTVNGRIYKDDPTIFAWELANEPWAQGDTSGDTLQGWIEEMAPYVKSIDPKHMLTTGGEGFYCDSGDWMHNGWTGADFIRNHQVPEIDFATLHVWPDNWGISHQASLDWYLEHIQDAHNVLGKPLLMEEFGTVRDAGGGTTARDQFFQDLFDLAETHDTAGWNFWILYHDDYPDYDGYGVYYPGDTSTINVITNAADTMNGKTVPATPISTLVTSVDITFDEPLDPASVNAANILLMDSGGDGRFDNGNDSQIVADSVTLEPDGLTAHFNVVAGLPPEVYRLTLLGSSSLLDLAGNSLDGEFWSSFPSGDGAAGGDFAATFTVKGPGDFTLYADADGETHQYVHSGATRHITVTDADGDAIVQGTWNAVSETYDIVITNRLDTYESGGVNYTNFTAESIGETSIHSDVLGTLTLESFDDGETFDISGSINNFTITGTGGIGGDLTAAQVTGTVTTGSGGVTSTGSVTATGHFNRIECGGNMAGPLTAASIGDVSVAGDLTANVTATGPGGGIYRLAAGGNIGTGVVVSAPNSGISTSYYYGGQWCGLTVGGTIHGRVETDFGKIFRWWERGQSNSINLSGTVTSNNSLAIDGSFGLSPDNSAYADMTLTNADLSLYTYGVDFRNVTAPGIATWSGYPYTQYTKSSIYGTLSLDTYGSSTSLKLGNLNNLTIATGDLEGLVTLFENLTGTVEVPAHLTGDVAIGGSMSGNLNVGGNLSGTLSVHSDIDGSIHVGNDLQSKIRAPNGVIGSGVIDVDGIIDASSGGEIELRLLAGNTSFSYDEGPNTKTFQLVGLDGSGQEGTLTLGGAAGQEGDNPANEARANLTLNRDAVSLTTQNINFKNMSLQNVTDIQVNSSVEGTLTMGLFGAGDTITISEDLENFTLASGGLGGSLNVGGNLTGDVASPGILTGSIQVAGSMVEAGIDITGSSRESVIEAASMSGGHIKSTGYLYGTIRTTSSDMGTPIDALAIWDVEVANDLTANVTATGASIGIRRLYVSNNIASGVLVSSPNYAISTSYPQGGEWVGLTVGGTIFGRAETDFGWIFSWWEGGEYNSVRQYNGTVVNPNTIVIDGSLGTSPDDGNALVDVTFDPANTGNDVVVVNVDFNDVTSPEIGRWWYPYAGTRPSSIYGTLTLSSFGAGVDIALDELKNLTVTTGGLDGLLALVGNLTGVVQVSGDLAGTVEVGGDVLMSTGTYSIKVAGELSGTIDIVGDASGGNKIELGSMSATGKLLAALFGDVEIFGDFLGVIGDAATANGTGTLLLHSLGGTIDGQVYRDPDGLVSVTGEDLTFDGAFGVIRDLVVTGGSGLFDDSGQNLGNSRTNGVALGDLDGDGDLDALAANWADQPANIVWLNNGAGVFSPSQNIGSSDSEGVVLGDLDGDGDLDAVFSNRSGQPNEVWLNDGTGTFFDSGQRLGNSTSLDLAIGDLDGDGDLDVFIVNSGANKIWLNDGTGTFVDSGQNLGSVLSLYVALADLDGDDDLDAFVANSGANKVWLNDGTGTFVDSGQNLGSANSYGVACGDLDGDGDLDAYVANGNPAQSNRVWLNDGTGTFIATQDVGNSYSRGVAFGDLDADGDLDAFVANRGANKVWLNDGTGTFSDNGQSLGSSEKNGVNVKLGDLDGDGDLDAFVVGGLYIDGQNVGGPNEVWLNRD